MTMFQSFLGQYDERIQKALHSFARQRSPERLWSKDPALWSSDPAEQEKIKHRLGWLTVVETMEGHLTEILEFGRSIKDSGMTHAVLLGMGGSSLCPQVCRRIYGVAEGYPDLMVVDTTDPETILKIEGQVSLKRCLFVVASKSGTTLEVQMLHRYFFEKMKTVSPARTGQHFVAITDPGTPLEQMAGQQGFRKIFLNPADIGGRFSALSYFGLVPAALIGMDLYAFLDRAADRVRRCSAGVSPDKNPGIRLGVTLGELGRAGRDKVTLVASPAIQSFGGWLEQLLAESTGKNGKGLVPVVDEVLGEPRVYAGDRLFVEMRLDGPPEPELDRRVEALQHAGHPVVRIPLRDPLDLAGEFFRWELAAAVAGAILGVNPFDEPNVTESKENTLRVLQTYKQSGEICPKDPVLEAEGIGLYGKMTAVGGSIKDTLWKFLLQARKGDYVALMAYLPQNEAHEAFLQELRLVIRRRLQVAATLGYGPRFLHSTGQLHKGGPSTGLFLQMTGEDSQDISIPGESYSFGTLKKAQALGDFHALMDKGRRVVRVHLGHDITKGLKKLLQWLKDMPAK